MIDDVLKETEGRMKKCIEALQNDLITIRTGRASPALIERLRVDYYGTQVPLNQLSTISAPEPSLIPPLSFACTGYYERRFRASFTPILPTPVRLAA